jgi:hypothetical protein
MKRSIADSLADLEARVGPIDEFVAKELGYRPVQPCESTSAPSRSTRSGSRSTTSSAARASSSATRPASARAGSTPPSSAGRSRTAASRSSPPRSPNLYADMYRDMTDIGMKFLEPPRILATNTEPQHAARRQGQGQLKTGDAKEHNALLIEWRTEPNSRSVRHGVHQLFADADGQGRGHRAPPLPAWHYRTNAVVISTSHNAGGQKRLRAQGQGPWRTARLRPRSDPQGQRRVLFLGNLRQAAGRDGPVRRDRHGDGGRKAEDLGEAIAKRRRADAAGGGRHAGEGRAVYPPRALLSPASTTTRRRWPVDRESL